MKDEGMRIQARSLTPRFSFIFLEPDHDEQGYREHQARQLTPKLLRTLRPVYQVAQQASCPFITTNAALIRQTEAVPHHDCHPPATWLLGSQHQIAQSLAGFPANDIGQHSVAARLAPAPAPTSRGLAGDLIRIDVLKSVKKVLRLSHKAELTG